MPRERMELDLAPDHGELPEHGVLDRLLRARVALQGEAEDRGEHEQQWEEREERVIRDQRREAARLPAWSLLNFFSTANGIASP